jgi:hypothetical protein
MKSMSAEAAARRKESARKANAANRSKALENWLHENDARALTEAEVPAGRGFRRFTMYLVNGKVVIVQREHGKDGEDQGWDIWVPAANSNDIRETLSAAEKHCGINAPKKPQPPTAWCS